MVVTISNHCCLQQIHQRIKKNSATSGHQRFSLGPETGLRYRSTESRNVLLMLSLPVENGDQSLAGGAQPHFHDPVNLAAEKAEFRAELKRKAANQHQHLPTNTSQLLKIASPRPLLFSTRNLHGSGSGGLRADRELKYCVVSVQSEWIAQYNDADRHPFIT